MSLEAAARAAGVDPACLALIARWEGYHKRLTSGLYGPYLCPARVATIGVGATMWPDGRKVTMQDAPVSRERCEEVLAFDLSKKYAPAVDRNAIRWAHENQRSACISFAYNVGSAGFGRSTLCHLLKQQQWDRAAREFMNWTMGGGRRLQGLVNRRSDERRLFSTPGGLVPQLETSSPAPTSARPAPIPQTPAQPSFWTRATRFILRRNP